MTASTLQSQYTTWQADSKLVEIILPRGILMSGERPEVELFTCEAWNCNGCCAGPFSWPTIAGAMQAYGWREKPTEHWRGKAQQLRWLESVEPFAPGFDHILRYRFTDQIFPAAPSQRWLFDPHAPPSFSGNLRVVLRLMTPNLLLSCNELSPSSKLTAWYLRITGDWERGLSRISSRDFRRIFNRDDRRLGEILTEWQDTGWASCLREARARWSVQFLKHSFLPDAYGELSEIRRSDPRRTTDICDLVGEPWLRKADGLIVQAGFQTGGVGDKSARSPACEGEQTGGVGDKSARSPACEGEQTGGVGDKCARSPACEEEQTGGVGDKSARSPASKESQICCTEKHQTATLDFLLALAEEESGLAQGLRKDLRRSSIRQRAQDLGKAELQKIEDQSDVAHRINALEKRILRSLNVGKLYPWFVFMVAAMTEGRKFTWYLRGTEGNDRPLGQLAFSEDDLARILETTCRKPTEQRRAYFIGAVRRRVLELAGFSREESAMQGSNVKTPACYELEQFANSIGYSWRIGEMHRPYELDTTAV